MTGYFISGFAGGIALALIFVTGKLYNYRKDADLSKRNIDRLERYNSDLQLKLKGISSELSF